MGRQVITAIMLEDLRREGTELRLAKDGLLTPAARDWLKEHDVPVTWVEPEAVPGGGALAVVMDPSLPEMRMMRTILERGQPGLEVIEAVGGETGICAATRRLCGKLVRQEVARGVVFACDGAVPVCVANKHNRVRAVLGTSVTTTEHACRELGVNLLVVEYANQTAYQVRQMVDRLLHGPTAPRPETAAVIENIEQGGGRADW